MTDQEKTNQGGPVLVVREGGGREVLRIPVTCSRCSGRGLVSMPDDGPREMTICPSCNGKGA